jgi:hypothetical protein
MRPRLIVLRLLLAAAPVTLSGCFLAAAGQQAISTPTGGILRCRRYAVDRPSITRFASFGQNGVTETGRSTETTGSSADWWDRGEFEVTVDLQRAS